MLYRLSYCGDRRGASGLALDAALIHGDVRVGKPESTTDARPHRLPTRLIVEQAPEEGLLALFCFLRLFRADAGIIRRAGEAFETLFLTQPGGRFAVRAGGCGILPFARPLYGFRSRLGG